MQLRPVLLVLTGLFVSTLANAQVQVDYNWWDPTANSFPVIDGQAWPGEVQAPYDRFPARAEKTLNPDVWELSHNSAGLYIKFKTNAQDLVVRYVLKGNSALPQMPATGANGVDLYAIDIHGNWVWAPGRFTFGDTVEYRFPSLKVGEGGPEKNFEYRLYLPLYNSVQWLRIGKPKGKRFTPMPLSPEKPVVVYGTSITQGGCATRPGLAWTSLLQRKLDIPLYNLGFRGSGKLESSVIDLITEIDAKLYVLDCLPNMTPSGGFSAEELEKRLVAAVNEIRLKRPFTPILLVDHSGGGTDHIIDTSVYNDFASVNEGFHKVFARLIAEGFKGIYTLSNQEIGLDINSTVDGVHPNDFGMIRYADAYEKKIRFILDEPSGSISTTIPVVQSRDYIGTNNLGINSDPEIIAGLKMLIQAVKVRQPSATILLSGILPRHGMEERIVLLNKNISRLAADRKLVFIDPGKVLLTGRGKIDESLFPDGVHPNAAGYERLAPVLASYLKD